MVDLNNGARNFFIFEAIVICNVLVAGSLYSLIGSLSPNETVGNIFVPVVTVLFFLFAGFFTAIIPDWWIWLYYWSFFHYSYEALMVNEFVGAQFSCGNTPPSACITTGEQVLAFRNIAADPSIIWKWILVLLGMAVGYRLLAYLVVRFLHKEKR
jgi:ATP-binding cassette, subfamily G (WHITE), eye pigment precursor transporter